ncbi:unnamed protein product, partial [Mesorhabditis belari]|uniref:Uncharacterized protein n=1 Tax=Mesorhabditis belari TaxID=2138241 RepID=A0AAF3FP80_9BILA
MFFQEPVIFERVDYSMSNYFPRFEDSCCEFPWAMSPSNTSERLDDDFRSDIKSEGLSTPPMCTTPDLAYSNPVPTASLADAAASLQSAFCKRPMQRSSLEANFQPTQVKQEVFEVEAHRLNNNNAYPYAHTMQNMEPIGEAAEGVDSQQIDIYRDLILRHLIQDISTTCARLGLPTDASHWTGEHSWKWIGEMCEQFNLPLPQKSTVTGRALLQMNQRDFESFAPHAGDTLYAQLQLWKTAFETYQQHQNNSCGGSFGMTAAESSGPKDWPSSSKSQVSRNFQLFPGVEQMSGFYNEPSPGSICDEELDGVLNIGPMSAMGGSMGEGQQSGSIPFRPSGTVHLWHFIRELLDQPKLYSHCVRWVDRDEGTFKIESSHALARIWGQRKNRSQMNYDKLSRSLRQYYKKGIIQKPEKKQRLVYKFLPPYNL